MFTGCIVTFEKFYRCGCVEIHFRTKSGRILKHFFRGSNWRRCLLIHTTTGN